MTVTEGAKREAALPFSVSPKDGKEMPVFTVLVFTVLAGLNDTGTAPARSGLNVAVEWRKPRRGKCYEAHMPNYPSCFGYELVGYTCVGLLSCADSSSSGFVNKKTAVEYSCAELVPLCTHDRYGAKIRSACQRTCNACPAGYCAAIDPGTLALSHIAFATCTYVPCMWMLNVSICCMHVAAGHPDQCAKLAPDGYIVDHASGTCVRDTGQSAPVVVSPYSAMPLGQPEWERLLSEVLSKRHDKEEKEAEADAAKRRQQSSSKSRRGRPAEPEF